MTQEPSSPSRQPATPGLLASKRFLRSLLLLLDITGLLLIFNLFHWLITDTLASDLLLNWKLLVVIVYACTSNYVMDLYSYHSPLSQLGIAERSFVAMLLTGMMVAITVYLIGPDYIGGFVGRGVLATSLLTSWIWSLFWRHFLNRLLKTRQSQTQWVLLTESLSQNTVAWFLKQFHEIYPYEQILILTRGTEDAASLDESTRLAGSWDDLENILEAEYVSGLVLAVNDLPEGMVNRLMNVRIAGTRVHSLNDFYEQYLSRVPVWHVDQSWIATSRGFDLIHNPLGLRLKRYIDVVVGLTGILLAIPVMLVCAILIFSVSGLPVLFKQKRMGEHGRVFTVYKFRTMRKDAEKDGARFAETNDPRLIPFGKTLRRFRADEIPQLFNVVKGNMSFIGPRPERPEFIAELQKEIPYYNLRHLVKPGLTGWAQVMHGYGDSTESAAEKLQYDLFYIKNYSLLLDIAIVLKSLKVVLFGIGR